MEFAGYTAYYHWVLSAAAMIRYNRTRLFFRTSAYSLLHS